MKKKIFFGIKLPKEIQGCVRGLVYDEELSDKISWTKVSNLHITLLYLGLIENKDVGILEEIVEKKNLVDLVKKDGITADKIELFPINSYEPETVVVRVKNAGIVELNKKLHIICKKYFKGSEIGEEKDFRAHITVGRIKKEKSLMKEDKQKLRITDVRCVFIVRGFELIESFLDENGKIVYKIIKEFR